jgi:outer membrane protein assembly factor BamB
MPRNALRLRPIVAVAGVAVMFVAGLTPAGAAGGSPKTDWATWGYDAARTGYNPNEATLNAGNVAGLTLKWTYTFSTTTLSPVVMASGVDIGGGKTKDIVYAGDNSGGFHAINALTGAQLWHVNLGTEPSPCYGIATLGQVSAGAIDRATNLIYVAGGNGKVYAFDLGTGAPASGWPVRVTRKTKPNEYIWGGLNLVGGILYATVGSVCDRNGPYYGRALGIDVATQKKVAIFYVTGGPATGIQGGGIWGWGGVAVDTSNRALYVTTGNSLTDPESYGYGDQVVRLTHGLAVTSSNYPGLTGDDLDFGGSPIIFPGPGTCGPQLAALNKDGEVFLYNRDDIAAGPEDRVFVNGLDLITVPAYDPVTGFLYVGHHTDSPDTTYPRGIVAFSITADCKLHMVWQQGVGGGGAVSQPVVANGVVYYGDGKAHTLFAFNALSGAKLWNSGSTIATWIDTEPIVVNGWVYVTSGSALYAFGL